MNCKKKTWSSYLVDSKDAIVVQKEEVIVVESICTTNRLDRARITNKNVCTYIDETGFRVVSTLDWYALHLSVIVCLG